MSRFKSLLIVLLVPGLLVATAGCNDPKERIAALEQENATAAGRINELQDLYSKADRDRQACEDERAALREQIAQLQKQLADASEPAPGWNNVPGGAMISVEGKVLFDSGKADLKTSGQKTLDSIVSAIRGQFADHDIYVFGHTDIEPIRESGWKDNYQLSCERSLAVVRYLKSHGVTQGLAACGWADQRPIADNSTDAGKQANRRVEIFARAPVENK